MSEGLNRVMLLGNLGAEPELRYTQGGQPVLNLRLATTEVYFDRERVKKERTDWHSVVVWGKRGEALSKILSKGSGIFVEGSLRTSSYEARDGTKRYKTEINARNIILTGPGRGRPPMDEGYQPQQGLPQREQQGGQQDDYAPQGGPPQGGPPQGGPPQGGGGAPVDDYPDDDDIPF